MKPVRRLILSVAALFIAFGPAANAQTDTLDEV